MLTLFVVRLQLAKAITIVQSSDVFIIVILAILQYGPNVAQLISLDVQFRFLAVIIAFGLFIKGNAEGAVSLSANCSFDEVVVQIQADNCCEASSYSSTVVLGGLTRLASLT